MCEKSSKNIHQLRFGLLDMSPKSMVLQAPNNLHNGKHGSKDKQKYFADVIFKIMTNYVI